MDNTILNVVYKTSATLFRHWFVNDTFCILRRIFTKQFTNPQGKRKQMALSSRITAQQVQPILSKCLKGMPPLRQWLIISIQLLGDPAFTIFVYAKKINNSKTVNLKSYTHDFILPYFIMFCFISLGIYAIHPNLSRLMHCTGESIWITFYAVWCVLLPSKPTIASSHSYNTTIEWLLPITTCMIASHPIRCRSFGAGIAV